MQRQWVVLLGGRGNAGPDCRATAPVPRSPVRRAAECGRVHLARSPRYLLVGQSKAACLHNPVTSGHNTTCNTRPHWSVSGVVVASGPIRRLVTACLWGQQLVVDSMHSECSKPVDSAVMEGCKQEKDASSQLQLTIRLCSLQSWNIVQLTSPSACWKTTKKLSQKDSTFFSKQDLYSAFPCPVSVAVGWGHRIRIMFILNQQFSSFCVTRAL